MITLYAADTANSAKIFIALEELAAPYRAKPVDLLKGGQFEADFVRLSPNAKVPVIVDDKGRGGRTQSVFESGAILLYLAEKTGRLIPARLSARSATVQWLMLQMSAVGPMMGQYIHFLRFAPKDNEYALNRYRGQVHRLFKVLDTRLKDAEWLDGSGYGIADIATFPWVRPMNELLGPDTDKAYPALAEWVARIAARPAVARADAAKARLASHLITPDKAEPGAINRLLGWDERPPG